ncbi:MAG: LysR substrate-binding domain-containing protein [Nitrospira sp.]|nr:LysR substrate-binding domain-containing protein [Nitrospira sp.]MDR4475089.1 LysR substrate-binding domain-containing protein [Nitrospira sp.]
MELRQIHYFMAVAAHQNFTRAAEQVHVSQPSLSIQIGALERELGTRLFDRLGRKVVLTQAGELFRVHAERAIRELDQAAQVVHELLGAKRGRLVVGTLSTVNSYLIAPLVSRFKQRFPDIHLQVHAQPSSDIVSGLLANRLDIGICLLPLTHPHMTTIPLFEERLALIAPASMSIGTVRTRMQDLARLPLVLMPVDYCLRKMVEVECAKAGVHPQVVLEMSSPEGILQAVAEGTGATILPELYVRSRLPATRLQVIDLYDPTPRHMVGLAYLTKRYRGVAAEEFAALCQRTMRDLQSASSPTLTAGYPTDLSGRTPLRSTPPKRRPLLRSGTTLKVRRRVG